MVTPELLIANCHLIKSPNVMHCNRASNIVMVLEPQDGLVQLIVGLSRSHTQPSGSVTRVIVPLDESVNVQPSVIETTNPVSEYE